MVDVKIAYCYPGKKRHVVHVADSVIFWDHHCIFFVVTFYGEGKVDYGIAYFHEDGSLTPFEKSIPLTREEVEHIVYNERGPLGNIDIQNTIKNGSDTVMLSRVKEGEVVCSVPMSPYIFAMLQQRCINALHDFELMVPYTDTRNGDITVTDPDVQVELTLVYLRVLFYNKSKIEENDSDKISNQDMAQDLVRNVKLADVNRFLKPAGLIIKCDEPLRYIFDDEEDATNRVLGKKMLYSAEYFKHAAQCGLNLGNRW